MICEITNYQSSEPIKYILNDALIPFVPLNMFMENKPANATIINKTPYKID